MKGKRLLALTIGRIYLLASLLAVLLLTPLPASGGGGTGVGSVQTRSSGDRYVDLVVGVPGENIGNVEDAGAVNVLYGSDAGLSAAGDQFWHQNSPDIAGTAESPDYFGQHLTAGDFDRDGYLDLAVGVLWEEIQGEEEAGAVNVLYGSDAGLSAADNQLWHQNSTGIADTAEEGDWFGYALAAGDFDGDGYTDLAVGVPSESIGAVSKAGAVHILYGSADGLTATGNQFWHQDSPGIWGTPETDEQFGEALAAGDLNGDGYADLAVGVPSESIGAVTSAGAVNILYGSASGLSATGNQGWNQDSTDVEDEVEHGDGFGEALAAGDLNGDGYDDLAVGVPYESIGAVTDAGAVNILYGSAEGLSATDDQFWHQDSPDIWGTNEDSDGFGSALTTGDLNGDGHADLAVGVPAENIGNVQDAGAVNVLYGSAAGLSAAGNQGWSQDSTGIADTAEERDQFGYALAAGDLDGDGYTDLAVGVPFESIGAATTAGAVNILYGSGAGLTATGNQLWHQDSPGVEDEAEEWDLVGYALAALNPVGYRVYLPLVWWVG